MHTLHTCTINKNSPLVSRIVIVAVGTGTVTKLSLDATTICRLKLTFPVTVTALFADSDTLKQIIRLELLNDLVSVENM